jgi:hypothetical protein
MIFNRSQDSLYPIRGAGSFLRQNVLNRSIANQSRFILLLMMCILCLFTFDRDLMAQKGLATLRGTITDPSGATISGVTLALIDPSSQITRGATTRDNGIYEFGAVNPGTYRLEVRKP